MRRVITLLIMFLVSTSGYAFQSISGDTEVCDGEIKSYSFVGVATSFSWTIVGGSLQSGQGTRDVTVIWNAPQATQYLSCNDGTQTTQVPVNVSEIGTLSGASTGCSSATGTLTYSGNTGGTILRWEKSTNNGTTWTTISHTAATYSYNLSQTTDFRVVVSLPCGTQNTNTQRISISNQQPGTISAPSSICLGSSTQLVLQNWAGIIDQWEQSTDGGSTWSAVANSTGLDKLTVSPTAQTRYRAKIQNAPCAASFTPVVILNIDTAPVAGTLSGGATDCSLLTGTLSLSGHQGSILRWERKASFSAAWEVISHTATTLNYSIEGPASYTYRAVVGNGACAEAFSNGELITVYGQEAAGTACSDDLIISDAVYDDLNIGANNSIVFSSQIEAGTTITAKSGSYVEFNPGFEAGNGTTFEASLGACTQPVGDSNFAEFILRGGTITGGGTFCEVVNTTLYLEDYNGPILYWESSTNNWASSTTIFDTNATLTLTGVTTATRYRAVIDNGTCGPVYSADALVSITPAPEGGYLPTDVPVCTGSDLTLTLSNYLGAITAWEVREGVESGGNVTYGAWTKATDPITTDASLTLNNITVTHLQVRALVSNGSCPDDYSQVSTITTQSQTVVADLKGGRRVLPYDNEGQITYTGYNTASIQYWEISTDEGQSWQNIGQAGEAAVSYAHLQYSTWYRPVLNDGTGCQTLSPVAEVIAMDDPINWIETKAYTRQTDGTITLIGHDKNYFNNHGQSIQTQSWDIASGKIFASQPLRDSYDRAAAETMTAPTRYDALQYDPNFVSSADGDPYQHDDFDTDINAPAAVGNTEEGTLGWYYSDNNSLEAYVATTGYPYSRTAFDALGTGEALKAAGPGDVHRMGVGHEAYSGQFPVTEELSHYIQTGITAGILPLGMTSLEDELIQIVSRDVNGRYSVVIQDRAERVLLASSQGAEQSLAASKTLNAGESYYFYLFEESPLTWTGTGTPGLSITNLLNGTTYTTQVATLPAGFYKWEHLSGNALSLAYSNSIHYPAYTYYDHRGQALLTLTPNAVSDLNHGVSYATVPKTTYDYDFQGRLVKMTEPDAGESYSYYRRDGKIRFSINALQKDMSRASYTNYDKSDRPVESGELEVNYSYPGGHAEFVGILEGILENREADGGINDATFSQGASVTVTRNDWVKTTYDEAVSNPKGWTQRFIRGGVSYTENASIKTWYSYDDLGRTEWMIQEIPGLSKVLTVEYAYDYLGNVTEVAYQREVPAEAFYHHFSYDEANRLVTVITSTDGNPLGATAREQASYSYYLHGPVKRMEIAEDLQGVDYVYTLQGWLKSINHPQAAKDPGGDGSNGFGQDAYAMTLEYFSGDYTRTGTQITSLDVPNHQEYYDGKIRGMSWYAARPASASSFGGYNMYAFQYDEKYQLTQATWGTPVYNSSTFTAAGNNRYQVSELDFDPNGNILNLRRRDGNGNDLHNFTAAGAANGYVYVAGKNQLASVAGHASYSYDARGQMITEAPDGGTTEEEKHVLYDVSGKVTEVQDGNGTTKVSFAYDDKGFRLMKKNHETGLETWYIRDAAGQLLSTYEKVDATLAQKEIPLYAAARMGQYYREQDTYLYELSDHLGNVRVTFTDANLEYSTSFEPEAFVYDEQGQGFRNIDETSQTDHLISRTGAASSWLNHYYGRTQGGGKTLMVSAGDVIDAAVYAKYLEEVPENISTAEALATWLASMSTGGGGESGGSGGSGGSTGGGIGAGDPLLLPDLYLNYAFYDQGMNLLNVGYVPMSTAAEGLDSDYEQLALQITAAQDGFVDIWVENLSQTDINTWTDDLSITHTDRVAIVQTTDYYPFGAVMADRDWKNPAFNYRFGYQGQFAEKDEETGWNSFELRQLDPEIGRWLMVDPYREFYSPYTAMGNSPTYTVDPDGGCTKNDENCENPGEWDSPNFRYNWDLDAYVLAGLEVSDVVNPVEAGVRSYQRAAAPYAYVLVLSAGGFAAAGSSLGLALAELGGLAVKAAPVVGRAAWHIGKTVVQSNQFKRFAINVGKNALFEYGHQVLNTKSFSKAFGHMDLFDVLTGTRISKSAILNVVSGNIDYSINEGLKASFLTGKYGEYNKDLTTAGIHTVMGAGIGRISNGRPFVQEAVLETLGGYYGDQLSKTDKIKKK